MLKETLVLTLLESFCVKLGDYLEFLVRWILIMMIFREYFCKKVNWHKCVSII
jgi:hypothetical protein